MAPYFTTGLASGTFRWSLPWIFFPLIKNFLEYYINKLYHKPAFFEGYKPYLFQADESGDSLRLFF